jgi:hypothetical protein
MDRQDMFLSYVLEEVWKEKMASFSEGDHASNHVTLSTQFSSFFIEDLKRLASISL